MRQKLIDLWKKDKTGLWLAFLIPFVISLIKYILDGVYPFGDNCILHIDMYHQYCPFFTEFMNKLKSGGNLMYTWNIGLGSDFISVYAYYLASPLNWLIFLCPRANVIEFMTLLIMIKTSFAGAAFYYYLKEHTSGNLRKMFALVFSTAYAFSGFMAAYSWNIMWMDSVALAPLIILGLEKLVKEEKVALYYVTLSISILANYYISIMICIFLTFYYVLLFFENKGKRLKSIFDFAFYSLLAGGTGVILMYPEMKILSYSGSSGFRFPGSMKWYFNIIAELTRGFATAPPYTSTEHWPDLYAGAFCYVLFFLYILNKRISIKEKIPRIAMVIFFILSFANNYLDFFWHGLHFPDSLPGRQSFLYIFLILALGYHEMENIRGTKLWHVAVSIVCCMGIVIAGTYFVDEEITDTWSAIITGIFIITYCILIVLYKLLRGDDRKIIKEMLVSLMLAELVINIYSTGFYTTSRVSYRKNSDNYEKLLDMAKEDALREAGAENEEQIFYRVEDTERLTKNDDAMRGYASATQFSSLMNINVSHFFQKLFMEGGKNYYCYNGATPLTSAMLGVKYMISDDPEGECGLRQLVGNSQELYLYKNNYTLPIGFALDEDVADDITIDVNGKIECINRLGRALGATEDLVSSSLCSVDATEGKTTISIVGNGYYFADKSSCLSDSLTFEYSDGHSTTYSKTTHEYFFDLGYCNAGDTITINNTKAETIEFYLYELNENALEEAYSTLCANPFILSEIADTKVIGSIDMKKAGKLIFSIPNEEGWSLLVDGKKQDIEYFEDTFISVSLEEGAHEIRLSYQTPGLKEGALVSGACIIIFVATMMLRKKKRHDDIISGSL